jgi:hypothetical protein
MAMIKRWRTILLTRLYVKYVFLPQLFEEIEESEWDSGVVFTTQALNPDWEDIEMAIREKDYNTLQ